MSVNARPLRRHQAGRSRPKNRMDFTSSYASRKCDSPAAGADGPTSQAQPQSQRRRSPLRPSEVWSRRPIDTAGRPATSVRFVTIGAASSFVARAGEMDGFSRHVRAPCTRAVT